MLTGQHVLLRAVRNDDLPALYGVVASLDGWEERSPRPPRPLPYETFVEWYRPRLEDPAVEFVIEVGGRMVGRCSLMREDALARHGEVGIGLRPEERGKGYGTDALRVLVMFGFQRRNLRRLRLECLASNAAALASYRKVGFVEEGRLREHAWVDGRYVDVVYMGLLRVEWRR